MKRKSFISVLPAMLLLAIVLSGFTACKKRGDDQDPAHEHTFATEWSKDETNHWHAATCEHKDEVKDKAAHKWDEGKVTKEATETEKGVKTYTCTVCAQIKTEEIDKLDPAHEHTFATEWSKDETNHWHAATCEHKDEVKDKAAHTWDAGTITTPATETTEGVKTYTCTACGQTKTENIGKLGHTHTFDTSKWAKDETNHWHAATCEHKSEAKDKAAHTWDAGKVTKAPTETETGVKTYTCTICGQTNTEDIAKLEHTHTFDTSKWAKDASNHWHAATCEHKDEVKDKAAHTWDAGTITTPATETTEGVKTYTCTVCGQTKTENTGKLDHTHTFDTSKWAKDASNHWHASTCGHADEKKDFSAHTWDAGKMTKAPTETATGVKTYTCTVCGQTKTEEIAKLEHTHTFDTSKWAKDADYHWHAATCEHKSEVKDKAAHTWDAGKITTPATETTEGVKTYTCTVCGQTKTENTGKLDHTHTFDTSKWAKDASNHWHASTCGHVEVKDKAAHTFDAGKVTKAPTETETGVKTYTCTVCGQTKTEEIAKLEHTHTFDTSKWAKDADYHWHASTCGHAEVKDKAAHTWNDGVLDIDPDIGEEGSMLYTCTVCGQTKSEVIPALDPFFMAITGKFKITGRGIVIEGTITSGTVSVGDTITMSGVNKPVTVENISIGSKEVASATAGEEVGLLISGVGYESIERGFCVYTPGTKSSYREFTLRLTLYTKAEGGRNTPISSGYAPQFRFYDYAADIKGQISLPADVEMMMPGETREVTVVLKSETILEAGMAVVVQEGGKTVGTGTVVSVSEHKHDASYDDYGVCKTCGDDQCVGMEKNSYNEFVATVDLEVNESAYLKVTPADESGTEYWRIEVAAAGGIHEGSDYEIRVYDSNGNEVTGDLETGKTYYIVIIGMNNINDVSITVLDHNAM